MPSLSRNSSQDTTASQNSTVPQGVGTGVRNFGSNSDRLQDLGLTTEGEGINAGEGISLPGNSYGGWDFGQSNNNGANSSDTYSSDITISFVPNAATVNSPEIAFIQDVKVANSGGASIDPRDNFQNRLTDEGRTLDRLDNRKYAYYGYNNDGSTGSTMSPGSAPTPLKSATLTDKPSWSVPNTRWTFETVAVAKSGAQANTQYGAITWGFDVDGDNKLTSHAVKTSDKGSASFKKSIDAWNDQANGSVDDRNHPDQVTVDPLT